MKSTLINMVSVLAGICLVASACVGVVNMITAEPIETSKKAATESAVSAVLSGIDFDEITAADSLLKKDALSVIVYRAMKGGEVAAYAVKAPSLTKDGFNGKVILMVGYTLDGIVNEVSVVEENETPGLGTNMEKPDNNLYKGVIKVHNALKEGDRVHVLAINSGKVYFVLDRVVDPDLSKI